jgi:hypothetical protein
MVKATDIRKLSACSGYLIEGSARDTTNIVCRRGQIYSDGQHLVAALSAGTLAHCRSLRKYGERLRMAISAN